MKLEYGDWIRTRDDGLISVHDVAEGEGGTRWIIAAKEGKLRAFVDSQIIEVRKAPKEPKRRG